MVKRITYVSIALLLAVLAAQPRVSGATTPGCERSSLVLQGKLLEFVEGQVAASTIAVRGEVTAAQALGTSQKLTFRLLNSWKGPFQVGETVSLTVPVTEFCGGTGCVFPFKIGDVTLLLSPSSYPNFLQGCWVYEGVAIQSLLLVPAALLPDSRH
jgi:hypothetical protein